MNFKNKTLKPKKTKETFISKFVKMGNGNDPFILDWNFIDNLLMRQVSSVDIATYLGISRGTLYNHCLIDKKIEWKHYTRTLKHKGLEILRLKQFEVAIDNSNITMLIFLGKNYLGQSDKLRQEIEENNNFSKWLKYVKDKR